MITHQPPTNPARSILDERPVRPPISGKVRTGIKVLTRAASAHPKAKGIYSRGVGAGKSFDQIEKELVMECGFEKSPLTPRNVPYFRVARADFTIPELADRILDLYGEERDQGRLLYRLPVILPFDDPNQVMPHQMRCYGKQLRYWSDYDATGQRFCMKHVTADVDTRNQRAKRVWGGRKIEVRGACEPEACQEYQRKECTLTGSLLFWIPGIPGSSLIELDTGSYYSLQQMKASMQMVAQARGKISGTEQGRPVFYLAKVEREVTMLDENQQPKRVKQFLVHLEADIAMDQVFAHREARALGAPAPAAAITAAAEPEAQTVDVTEPTAEPAKSTLEQLRDEFAAEAKRLYPSIDEREKLMDRVAAKFGRGWSRDEGKLRAAVAELNAVPF